MIGKEARPGDSFLLDCLVFHEDAANNGGSTVAHLDASDGFTRADGGDSVHSAREVGRVIFDFQVEKDAPLYRNLGRHREVEGGVLELHRDGVVSDDLDGEAESLGDAGRVIVQSRHPRLRDQFGPTVGFACSNGGVQKECIENVSDRNADSPKSSLGRQIEVEIPRIVSPRAGADSGRLTGDAVGRTTSPGAVSPGDMS